MATDVKSTHLFDPFEDSLDESLPIEKAQELEPEPEEPQTPDAIEEELARRDKNSLIDPVKDAQPKACVVFALRQIGDELNLETNEDRIAEAMQLRH